MSTITLAYLNECFSINESIENRRPYIIRGSNQTLKYVNPWVYLKHEELHDLIKHLPIRSLEDSLEVKISLEDRLNTGYYFVHIPYPEEFHSEEDYLYVMLSAAAITCQENPKFAEILPEEIDLIEVGL